MDVALNQLSEYLDFVVLIGVSIIGVALILAAIRVVQNAIQGHTARNFYLDENGDWHDGTDELHEKYGNGYD